ncbi:hypothetical protein D0T84_14585 [Dysgonomonas sp. 521]|uniref:hypothetical protein n=1 Tax=Dysgonomonas sp. 521 TaxID=2302932 RepID=UPI0013D7B055|nr:hypothetical protein [Dysgonomonas sp. 521]NDV96129.1 hypothetical protein [Dysgonomonas sp. 521]
MKPYKIILLFALLAATVSLRGQITIGSDIPPTRAALLDLKARQTTGTLTSVTADENITAALGDGGLVLPRVKLVSISTLEPFIPADDAAFTANTNSLKEKLAGLMVYNMTNNGVGSALYPAVYTWDGEKWVTTQANEAASSIITQPLPFTFYETGEETINPLTFVVEGLGDWTFQWYQITGNNVHVRISTAIGSSDAVGGTVGKEVVDTRSTALFTPTGVKKGTTRKANNTGFYKFYCIAESSMGARLESDIAEVAVGCGAKNNAGEWISFMCFNLGAGADIGTASYNGITIQEQKDYPIGTFTNNANGVSNQHAYIPGEEKLWGSLFQWGRIADGHELRLFTGAGGTPTNTQLYSGVVANDIVNGSRCSASDTYRPYQQVKNGTAGYGKFITGGANWTPISQVNADQLWRTGRFIQNDPCAHYKTDGSYHEFWHNGTDGQNKDVDGVTISPACTDVGTAWRTPSQDEWASIYRGGTISGDPGNATANTWSWYNGTSTNYSRGYEIKPDGTTATLFLPASGNRNYGNNSLLYNQSTGGNYWSISIININAYYLFFNRSSVSPAFNINRAYGFALRCIKNS